MIPIKTVSEANCSEHWTQKHKRHKNQKLKIKLYLLHQIKNIKLPCIIKLTRVGKRKLDDDNLPPSLKYVRDAIADLIFPGLAAGQADNDKRLIWQYDQMTAKDYAIIVSFLQM